MIENRKSTETVKQWQWWTAVQRSGCRQSWPSSLSDEVPSAYRACQRSQRWKGVHSQRSVRSRTGFWEYWREFTMSTNELRISRPASPKPLMEYMLPTLSGNLAMELPLDESPWARPLRLFWGEGDALGDKLPSEAGMGRDRVGFMPRSQNKLKNLGDSFPPFLVQWKDVKNFKKSQMPEESASGWRWWRWWRWSIAGRGLLTDPLGKLHGMQCALVAADGDLSLRLGIRCGCLQVSCSKTRFEAHLF